MTTKVLINGILGRMGSEVLSALIAEPDMEPCGGVDRDSKGHDLVFPDENIAIPTSTDLSHLIKQTHPDVMVDFTQADATLNACRTASANHINLVIGTTGMTEGMMSEIAEMAKQQDVGAFIAPNFSIGAVLILHLAKGLGKYFDYADIVEMHHENKIDAPSGTAIAMARTLVDGRGSPFTRNTPTKEPVSGTRGGDLDGVGIHSIRMPGRMAHHEITLGTQGQTVTLKHDTINRACYMPGVILAIREVTQYKGLVVGLENILRM